MSALWPVQVAVYTALTNHATLMTRVSGVYDGRAPQGAAMPYIAIGTDKTEVPANTLGNRGWSDTVVIHIISDYNGNYEALDLILPLVNEALANPLPIDGHQSARLRPVAVTPFEEEDGIIHVPARFRVTTREVA